MSTPIGVLLIVFESRPDCLPQIAALAIRSGNGLLLKGGKEAEQTNALLCRIVKEAITDGSNGSIDDRVVSLVSSRDDVYELLKMHDKIDLVIPRGSNQLVQSIKTKTQIPVLGHADGVCHVYVDAQADEHMAVRIIVDSKCDYPSACNATECIILHADVVSSGLADRLLRVLRQQGVCTLGSSRAVALGLTEQTAANMHCEYGDLKVSIEVVDDVDAAIAHINRFGSGHTDCIVTSNDNTAHQFIAGVDSACVFHNASTRFADGYRFGLGAEVGISTGRIHARGPVGVDGLLTSKWILKSSSQAGHIVASNSQSPYFGKDPIEYTHRLL